MGSFTRRIWPFPGNGKSIIFPRTWRITLSTGQNDAFLRDMKAVVGARVFNAIVGISKMLALDYGGIDFGIDLNGNAILFEANAYMNVPLAESDNRWDYRRESISRIWDATRRMLWERPLILKG